MRHHRSGVHYRHVIGLSALHQTAYLLLISSRMESRGKDSASSSPRVLCSLSSTGMYSDANAGQFISDTFCPPSVSHLYITLLLCSNQSACDCCSRAALHTRIGRRSSVTSCNCRTIDAQQPHHDCITTINCTTRMKTEQISCDSAKVHS